MECTSLEEALLILSEGFCPDCFTSLEERTKPLIGFCPTCSGLWVYGGGGLQVTECKSIDTESGYIRIDIWRNGTRTRISG